MSLPELGGVWLWKDLGKEIVQHAPKERWAKFNWVRAAEKYRKSLSEQHAEIHIFGQPEPALLEGIFTHIHTTDEPMTWQRFDIEALREAVERYPRPLHALTRRLGRAKAERIDGLALVAKPGNDRLFILGKPGVGKTTFLKYLTLQAARGHIDKIPIFVSLKAWAHSGLGLLPFIGKQFEVCDFPDAELFVKQILQKGQALVLFDGLNEVRRQAREHMRLIDMLKDLGNQYRESQCLITCRTVATDYTFERFKYVEIADFTDRQMYIFVQKWFKGDDVLRDKFWEGFSSEENRGLQEMGRIPLLLNLLCLAFQETLALPQRRVEIYEQALDALLKKWDTSRKTSRDEIYHRLSLGRKRQMLARLAAETFEQGNYFLHQADLERQIVAYLQNLPSTDQEQDIDGRAIVKAIKAQHGILVEHAHQIYAFPHLTFQEYFTAKYMVDNVGKGTLPRLLRHCTDERWREVILLTATLLDDADSFFAEFLQAVAGSIGGDEHLVAFIEWAARKAAAVEAAYKPAALRSYYCHFALARARDRPLTRALDLERALDLALDHALDLAGDLVRDHALDPARDLAHTLDLTRTIAYARDLALERVLEHDLERDHALDLARDLALDLARDLDLARERAIERALDLALDRDLARALDLAHDLAHDRDPDLARALKGAFEHARDFARDLAHDPDLHHALTGLVAPIEDAPRETWRGFADELQAIVMTHRDIGHDWNFTTEQFKRLAGYFEAHRLLVECLNLAYVSDRAGIEERLLLPPGGSAVNG